MRVLGVPANEVTQNGATDMSAMTAGIIHLVAIFRILVFPADGFQGQDFVLEGWMHLCSLSQRTLGRPYLKKAKRGLLIPKCLEHARKEPK